MSSLFGALVAAVSGVAAQSSALGNISDNISNANTIGFKSVSTSFSSLVTASSAVDNNPGGVSAKPQYNNDVQGNISATSTNTSLAISGQGYFPVQTATLNATGATVFTGNQYYTRAGDFSLDSNGYMVNSANYYLMGYSVAADGTVNTASTQPIQISSQIDNPVATTQATYLANLPASATTGYTSIPSTVNVYDALGNTHTMSFTWTKTATDDWNLKVDITGGNGVMVTGTPINYTATIPFVFNNATNTGTPASITPGSFYTVVSPIGGTAEAAVQWGLNFPGASAQTMSINFGNYNEATGLTQYADSAVSVTSFQQNGLAKGSYSSLSINNSGIITINYNNGSERPIAQIPIVQFYAQDQLQSVTGNAYSATNASGSPRYNIAGTSGAGSLVSSSLESSNVDIATQFTNMIQAQEVYSANAKVITTVSTMLNTIVQAVQ